MSKKILLALLAILFIPSLKPALAYLYRPESPFSIVTLGISLETTIWVIFTFIVVLCFVISGILFLTAQGQPEKLKIAKASFIWGVVGVVVGILAYSILYIIERLMYGII